MLTELTDAELILEYVVNDNNTAFETLMRRHYDITYNRFLKNCRNPDDAIDLTQSLWMKMLTSLENYKDEGKFTSFLMSCISNSLTDFWRRKGVKDRVIEQKFSNEFDDPIDNAIDRFTNTVRSNELQQQVNYLTNVLIPDLPCEQRLVFLLKHESEYWEDKQRLDWQHLAELNNSDVETVWRTLEKFRNAMLSNINGAKDEHKPSCEDNLLFLVWTQSQRPFKTEEYTWDYFSKILNISDNTLKTRYRAALKSLAKGLEEKNKL